MQLRFQDIDINRHVNNSAYFSILETARVQLARLPLPVPGTSRTSTLLDEIGAGRTNFITDHYIEYRNPLDFRVEPVAVVVRVARIGTSSFDFCYEVAEPGGGTCYAAAYTGLTVVGLESGQSEPIGQVHRSLLESLLDEPPRFRRFTPPV